MDFNSDSVYQSRDVSGYRRSDRRVVEHACVIHAMLLAVSRDPSPPPKVEIVVSYAT